VVGPAGAGSRPYRADLDDPGVADDDVEPAMALERGLDQP
jgi:hypothetical protein